MAKQHVDPDVKHASNMLYHEPDSTRAEKTHRSNWLIKMLMKILRLDKEEDKNGTEE